MLRSGSFQAPARIEVRQGSRLLASSRTGRLVPARPVHLAAAWAARIDPAGGPVRITAA